MKKLIVALLLLISCSSFAQQVYTSSGKAVNARKQQKRDKGFDTDKLIFGGWFGAQFGTVTSVNISPIVGYKISERFAAGIGVGYQYFNYKDNYEKDNVLQLSVWGRYKITDQIFAHVEPQNIIASYKIDAPNGYYDKGQISYNKFLVGGGYRTPITERSSFTIMLLYDVLQDVNNPNPNKAAITPMMGFNIGF
jgi:hypothetical protein